MQSLRNVWLLAHRWIALTFGSVLILSGITGAALVVARPLDRWLHPEYFLADAKPAQAAASLESIRLRLAAEFGETAALTFRPPREAGETLQVLVRSAWRGVVFLHPVSGREQGRRSEDDGFVNVVYELHNSLMLKETGKAVLAIAALAYLVLLATGLVLWWPRRWAGAWRIELRRGMMRSLFDMHRVGGAIAGLLIVISVATGAFLAWRPIGVWISAMSGDAPMRVPRLAGAHGPSLPLDQLAASAQAALPDASIGYLMIPSQRDRPLRVRLRTPDDPHPNGMSSVWVDPRTGVVLATHRWNELDTGTRINATIYPLHTGELGGVALEAVVALLGIMLGALGATGLWLWWKRQRARRGSARLNVDSAQHRLSR